MNIDEVGIHFRGISSISFDQLTHIVINNEVFNKKRSFGLQTKGNGFNFLAKDNEQRNQILLREIMTRFPSSRINRAHWKTIKSAKNAFILEINHKQNDIDPVKMMTIEEREGSSKTDSSSADGDWRVSTAKRRRKQQLLKSSMNNVLQKNDVRKQHIQKKSETKVISAKNLPNTIDTNHAMSTQSDQIQSDSVLRMVPPKPQKSKSILKSTFSDSLNVCYRSGGKWKTIQLATDKVILEIDHKQKAQKSQGKEVIFEDESKEIELTETAQMIEMRTKHIEQKKSFETSADKQEVGTKISSPMRKQSEISSNTPFQPSPLINGVNTIERQTNKADTEYKNLELFEMKRTKNTEFPKKAIRSGYGSVDSIVPRLLRLNSTQLTEPELPDTFEAFMVGFVKEKNARKHDTPMSVVGNLAEDVSRADAGTTGFQTDEHDENTEHSKNSQLQKQIANIETRQEAQDNEIQQLQQTMAKCIAKWNNAVKEEQQPQRKVKELKELEKNIVDHSPATRNEWKLKSYRYATNPQPSRQQRNYSQFKCDTSLNKAADPIFNGMFDASLVPNRKGTILATHQDSQAFSCHF